MAHKDLVYTTNSAANLVLSDICFYFDLFCFDYYIEPSAGAGVFIKLLLQKNISQTNILSFDLIPNFYLIKKQDYLLVDFSTYFTEAKVLFISNVPWGKNGSLALKFLYHSQNHESIKIGSVLAFILPLSLIKKDFYVLDNWEVVLKKELPKTGVFETPNGNKVNNIFGFLLILKKVDNKNINIKQKKQVKNFYNNKNLSNFDKLFFTNNIADASFIIRRTGYNSGYFVRKKEVLEKNVSNFICINCLDFSLLKKILKNKEKIQLKLNFLASKSTTFKYITRKDIESVFLEVL